MTPDTGARRPLHLWIVGVVSLLWNSIGAFDYFATQMKFEAYLSQSTPEQLAYVDASPAWAIAAWAFGVWGAFVGSLCLLARHRCAVYAFAVSLVGLAASTVYQFVLTNAREVMPGAVWMISIVWVIAIALLWYSIRQSDRGVLR